MMNIVFKKRDFSETLQPPASVTIRVERYRHSAIGGPERAYLRASAPADTWDLMDLLRAPVEIWDEGKCLWWGYVNKITAPHGPRQRLGLALDEMYNYVVVAYEDGDTAAASDATSVTEYGQKEIRINNLNATQAEAEATRGLYLANHQEGIREIEMTGGSDDISVECYGWYSTLGWKYYTDSDSTNTDNATQISNIVAGAGQFFRNTIIEQAAGITSNEYRDGRSTALTYINQLLDAGTSNTRPMLAYVDRHRNLHVYERPVEPPANLPDYLLDRNGQLLKKTGAIVPPKECTVGIWVKAKDVPGSLGGFSTMGPVFIQSAEYNYDRNETIYRFANAYEQIRLAKYIASIVSGNSDGSGGVSSYYPYIPVEEHVHIRPRLHRNGTLSGITSAGYVPFTITPTRNLTYAGLSYFTPTTISSKDAWKVLVSGIYNIELYLNIVTASVTTTGAITLDVLRTTDGSTLIVLFEASSPVGLTYGGGTSGYWQTTVAFTKKLLVDEYLTIRVNNATDASTISVNNGELIATLERATG